jgi:hypothetical protein
MNGADPWLTALTVVGLVPMKTWHTHTRIGEWWLRWQCRSRSAVRRLLDAKQRKRGLNTLLI